MASEKPVRSVVRISQTRDTSGKPAEQHFEHVITQSGLNTVSWQTLLFLETIQPTRTHDPREYTYLDPGRGSGTLRLEGFHESDVHRIQELVHVAEIERAVGKRPLRNVNPDRAIGAVLRVNNPYVYFVWAAVVFGLGLYALTSASRHGDDALVFYILGSIIAAMAIPLAVVGAIRLPWWRRARAYARRNGGVIPSDIKGI